MRITTSLIAVNVAVFILQAIIPPFTEYFALTPELAINSGYIWQFFTYMFLHGGIMHITFNMFVLFMFGSVIEHTLGERKYISLYLISGVGSALLYMVLTGIFSGLTNVPMLGASGAIFGVLAAYGFMFPKNIIFVFPGIPLPAIFVVVGFAVLELFSGIFGLQPGIANFGHLGGIITGVLMMFYWKRSIVHKLRRSASARREFEYFWE
jgi:membrane associated rhomboid family serine protease